MKKHLRLFSWLMLLVFNTSCKDQVKNDQEKNQSNFQSNNSNTSNAPNSIVRNIVQDGKGNIWMATWEGVFRYDGKSFTNVTKQVSSARFFSVLEDSKGNMWFGSIGSGVYYFDGKDFQNFTTKEGLPNNEITSIYEDKAGNIWLGTNGGISLYNGKSFQNFILAEDNIVEDNTGKTVPDFTRPSNEVNSIIEDKTGKYWFATRGNTYLYNGKTFTIVSHKEKPFTNVRSIIQDKKGNIWLGGNDGLWRYDPSTSLRAGAGEFTNISKNFIGYIHEDEKGNIWTSSQTIEGSWVPTLYYSNTFLNKKPSATLINTKEIKILFGILAAKDGSIWFGSEGVYRYNRKTITDFRSK
ncbi:ligand-binding sensor domain-containing protein [Cyclobacterium amurskyense]|uniref:Two component regulator propeller domain protein n=1 Tax=Cyclobacterium amurskyense TaxID=320787 RepID=A0A0H4PZ98_9BACT|nr:two-component regulator propeller domain-containing protein [Cyclobacterium amurskyense]AKP53747.1 Two component regulator propeller domain protein [Cyclobacterium amurskyense]